MHIKRFLEWIGLKEKLHLGIYKVPHVSQGEIWWASLGENIGFEINGKSRDFSRPVIILKKLNHGFFFVLPVTSQNKIGTWFVNFTQKGRQMTACLHQARSIDYRRLHSKLGRLDDSDFEKIKDGFRKLIP